jgi:hypothetical protein
MRQFSKKDSKEFDRFLTTEMSYIIRYTSRKNLGGLYKNILSEWNRSGHSTFPKYRTVIKYVLRLHRSIIRSIKLEDVMKRNTEIDNIIANHKYEISLLYNDFLARKLLEDEIQRLEVLKETNLASLDE